MLNYTRSVTLTTFLPKLISDINSSGLWEIVQETSTFYYIKSKFTSNKTDMIRLGNKEEFQNFAKNSHQLYVDFAETGDNGEIQDREKTFSQTFVNLYNYLQVDLRKTDLMLDYFLSVSERFIHVAVYLKPWQCTSKDETVCQVFSFGIMDDSSEERYCIFLTDSSNSNKGQGSSSSEYNLESPFGHTYSKTGSNLYYGLAHKAGVAFKYGNSDVTTSMKINNMAVFQIMTRFSNAENSNIGYYNGNYRFRRYPFGWEGTDNVIDFSQNVCSSTVDGSYMGVVPNLLQNEQTEMYCHMENGEIITDANGMKFKVFSLYPYSTTGGSFYKVVAIPV